jgi:hypothetical protein
MQDSEQPKKFSLYQVGERFFIKTDGQDEREISKMEYYQLQEICNSAFDREIERFKESKQ